MKRLLELKLKIYEKDYPKHLELFKKETGIVLDVEDVHTFAKFNRWKTRRIKDSVKATVAVEQIFMKLDKIYYKNDLNFDSGICIDPMKRNIYFPSDGSDADGKLFHVDPVKSSGLVTQYFETDPLACEMVYKALEKVEEMKEEYEYNQFVSQYS